ncbi:hypothetical protein JAO10_01080 [Burkholderia contaminans]|uniref:hypothetical protein n=1 Tax=Burkholderia contaminans TaxID=488447 RepID=UPI0018DC5EF6|nr:hypothetical protein [Burkholderia contaminans]MBH9718909.1 hypothetical protein [Burkholderia contaminans]
MDISLIALTLICALMLVCIGLIVKLLVLCTGRCNALKFDTDAIRCARHRDKTLPEVPDEFYRPKRPSTPHKWPE